MDAVSVGHHPLPSHAKGIQADLISVFDLFEELPQAVRCTHSTTAVVERGRDYQSRLASSPRI